MRKGVPLIYKQSTISGLCCDKDTELFDISVFQDLTLSTIRVGNEGNFLWGAEPSVMGFPSDLLRLLNT